MTLQDIERIESEVLTCQQVAPMGSDKGGTICRERQKATARN